MSWITPAESDVLTVLSETELATYRAAATASGQADPVAPTLAQVVDMVRGYVGAYKPNTLGLPGTIPQKLLATALDLMAVRLPQRVGVPPKDVRQMAANRAVRLLEQVEASGNATLEAVLDAFLRPALTAGSDARFGGRVFARLRARLATEPEAFSRRILADAFDDSSKRTIAALQRQLPELPAEELFWRFHFLLGAMVYTMADPGRIQSLSDGKCDPGDVEAALRHIVPFLAAGFRAAPETAPKRRKT